MRLGDEQKVDGKLSSAPGEAKSGEPGELGKSSETGKLGKLAGLVKLDRQEALERLKPGLKRAAGAAGEAGQAKLKAYASRAVNASKEILRDTDELAGEERKKHMKKLVLERSRMPFPVRWCMSSTVEKIVGVAVDVEEVRRYVCAPFGVGCAANEENAADAAKYRQQTVGLIMERIGVPFYLKGVSRRVVGCALDVAVEYKDVLSFVVSTAVGGRDAADPAGQSGQNGEAEFPESDSPAESARPLEPAVEAEA